MIKVKRKLGSLPSPSDYRDWRISKIARVSDQHEKEYETEWLPPVYDQGLIGSCVAFALKTIREIQQYKETGQHNSLSAGFIYANRAEKHWQGEGMYPSQALHQLKHNGVCLNSLFYMNTFYKVLKQLMKDRFYINAKPYKITGYARAYSDSEIKSAVKELGAVLISIPIYKNFLRGNHVIEKPSQLKIEGHHAVVIYGWTHINNKLYWKIRNSWGIDWCNKGNCLLADDYCNNMEAWAITDAPDVGVEQFKKMTIGESIVTDTKTGEKKDVKYKATLINNKAYVPVRALGELFNKEVGWDYQTKTLYIKY